MTEQCLKVFISYKHSETTVYRNKFARALEQALFLYVGETDETKDLSGRPSDEIKYHIRGMIAKSQVTVIILSPQMALSNWIDTEISYSLQDFTYIDENGAKFEHKRNGIVGVLVKGEDGYNWAMNSQGDIHLGTQYDETKFCDLVKDNRRNRIDFASSERKASLYCEEMDSYISIVTEDEFLKDVQTHIQQAYQKSLMSEAYYIQEELPY